MVFVFEMIFGAEEPGDTARRTITMLDVLATGKEGSTGSGEIAFATFVAFAAFAEAFPGGFAGLDSPNALRRASGIVTPDDMNSAICAELKKISLGLHSWKNHLLSADLGNAKKIRACKRLVTFTMLERCRKLEKKNKYSTNGKKQRTYGGLEARGGNDAGQLRVFVDIGPADE